MNKHTRTIVVVLFVILILLAAAIIIFHVDVNKAGDYPADRTTASDDVSDDGSRIFRDEESGRYGLMDESSNIILDAEWQSLTEIGSRCFLAELRSSAQTLVGVIDNEGSIVVPFVYAEMERLTDFLYVGKLAADGKYFFYDAGFRLLLPESWEEYSLIDETLHLKKDGGTFVYGLGADLELIEISIPRRIRPISFDFRVRSAYLLRMMERRQWCQLADYLMTYLDAYRREQLERLEEITAEGRLPQVLHESDTGLVWRGGEVTGILFYSEEEDDQTVLHCETELMMHAKNETEEKPYKLRLTFAPDSSGEWMLYDAEFSEISAKADFLLTTDSLA